MTETIQLGDVSIAVTRKDIKNVHLSVHPPNGRVTLSAPKTTRLEVARAYAISKLGFLQRMKTKWGSCNHRVGHIRLNTELVKKPKDLLEYVMVHEMAHLIEPTHNDRFIVILEEHFPTWRDARAELNELPLTSEVWNE